MPFDGIKKDRRSRLRRIFSSTVHGKYGIIDLLSKANCPKLLFYFFCFFRH
jgi:hypothetical protein